MLKKIRWLIEFAVIYALYIIVRIMPRGMMRVTAWLLGFLIHLLPAPRKLVRANIHTAMPELSSSEVNRIARSSFDHMLLNLVEYIWLVGNEKRIRRFYALSDSAREISCRLAREKTQAVFVNPHLGSWEASGLMSPFYAGIKLAAIAKPVRNPYLNKLLNKGNRESTQGLRIIFSKGALRASLQALREGWSIGTLIDQNTKVRDGGAFVDFFGLPVPSTTAPALLKEYCDNKQIPCEILFACSLRNKEGKVICEAFPLKKPFAEYGSHLEILQELMATSEKFIRENPEQYLWMYHRFQYIPDNATPEQVSRFPWYAVRPGKNFYRKIRNRASAAEKNGKITA